MHHLNSLCVIDVYAMKSSISKILVFLSHNKYKRKIIENSNLSHKFNQTVKKSFFENKIIKMQFKVIIKLSF